MELDKIKELVEMMKANDLSELEIGDGQTRIVLKRGTEPAARSVIAIGPAAGAGGVNTAPANASANIVPAQKEVVDEAAAGKLTEIVAPLVGTLYTAPSPNAGPFLEVGAKVEEETVVCIIEAMKVMNEIKSGVRGTIKKILVENGSAVEYGQVLFLVEPE